MTETARLSLALAAALLASASPAAATTLLPTDTPAPLTRGPIEFHPHAGFSQSYDSNIFLQSQPVSSWISTLDGGLKLPGMIADHSRYDLDYDVANRWYSRDPGVGNGVIQSLDGHYWYEAPSGLKLRVRDNYLNTIDQASTELTALRRRWQNLIGGGLAYEPEGGEVFLQGDFDHTRYKYVTDDPVLRQQLDRYEQEFGGRAGWQLQPKTVVYAAYHRQLIHYTNASNPSRDSKSHLVDFGVDGDLTPKMTGKAQVGVVDRTYDAAPSPGLSRETNNMTALVALSYTPADRSNVDLSFTRSLEESAFDINQFYIATAGLLTLTHRFPRLLFARLYGGMEWDKYPTTTVINGLPVNRRDNNYQGGVSLEYPIRDSLRIGLGYLYRARSSRDLPQFDYHDQITTLSANLTF